MRSHHLSILMYMMYSLLLSLLSWCIVFFVSMFDNVHVLSLLLFFLSCSCCYGLQYIFFSLVLLVMMHLLYSLSFVAVIMNMMYSLFSYIQSRCTSRTLLLSSYGRDIHDVLIPFFLALFSSCIRWNFTISLALCCWATVVCFSRVYLWNFTSTCLWQYILQVRIS